MFGSSGPRGISNIPTYRSGRIKSIEGTDSYSTHQCSRWIWTAVGLVFFLLGGVGMFVQETNNVISSEALAEVRMTAVDINGGNISANAAANQPAYFRSSTIKSATVKDDEVSLSFDRALKVERHSEYCQWRESHVDVCETCYRDINNGGNVTRESYSCNCRREYSYMKSWRNSRINSLLFDQPAAHWNPQDDPIPSLSLFAHTAKLGSRTATPALIRHIKGKARHIKYTLDGKREAKWHDVFTSWLGWTDSSRIETLAPLSQVPSSPAAQIHRFIYAGQGYFFRPYQVSVQERLLKAFFQYVEGSLLDYQLGDLVPSCEAGDIKFHYRVLDPEKVSGVGQIKREGSSEVLDEYTTTKGKQFAILHAGDQSLTTLLESETWELKRNTWLVRVFVTLPLAYIVNLNILAFAGRMDGLSASKPGLRYWFIEVSYVVAVGAFLVASARFAALRAHGMAESVDATGALAASTIAFLVYSEGLIRALHSPRRPADEEKAKAADMYRGGWVGLWRLWTEPSGVFVDGIYSKSATIAASR